VPAVRPGDVPGPRRRVARRRQAARGHPLTPPMRCDRAERRTEGVPATATLKP
jgi:hypothetical protein